MKYIGFTLGCGTTYSTGIIKRFPLFLENINFNTFVNTTINIKDIIIEEKRYTLKPELGYWTARSRDSNELNSKEWIVEDLPKVFSNLEPRLGCLYLENSTKLEELYSILQEFWNFLREKELEEKRKKSGIEMSPYLIESYRELTRPKTLEERKRLEEEMNNNLEIYNTPVDIPKDWDVIF